MVCRYECALPVWSCAWNADDRSYFYAGLQNGTVLVFDIRNLSEPVMTLNQDRGSRSPVVSVQYMPGTSGNSIRYSHSLQYRLFVLWIRESSFVMLVILLSVQCNRWHWTDYKITFCLCVWPAFVCGQDCDLNFALIFTKFGTQLIGILNIRKKRFFWADHLEVSFRVIINLRLRQHCSDTVTCWAFSV